MDSILLQIQQARIFRPAYYPPPAPLRPHFCPAFYPLLHPLLHPHSRGNRGDQQQQLHLHARTPAGLHFTKYPQGGNFPELSPKLTYQQTVISETFPRRLQNKVVRQTWQVAKATKYLPTSVLHVFNFKSQKNALDKHKQKCLLTEVLFYA